MRNSVLITVLILGLSASGTAIADTPPKPFTGTFIAVDSPHPPTADCPVNIGGTQRGRASHFAEFSGASIDCGFDLKVMVSPPFNPGGSPPYLVAQCTNDVTWIGANGDELVVETVGVFVQSLPDVISGLRGTMTVVGGTGGFAGATGQAEGRRDGATRVTFEGWIDYDALDVSGS